MRISPLLIVVLAVLLICEVPVTTAATKGSAVDRTGTHAGTFEEGVAARRAGNHAEAFRILLPLAEKGHAIAQSYIGVMYLNGKGVGQNSSVALRWMERSAEQGNRPSMLNMAYYYRDRGRNLLKSYMWYTILSTISGQTSTTLNRVAKQLTPTQIREAEDLAYEWIRQRGLPR